MCYTASTLSPLWKALGTSITCLTFALTVNCWETCIEHGSMVLNMWQRKRERERGRNTPGVNLSIDSSPAIWQQAHMLSVFRQHHITPVKGPARLTIPVASLGHLCLHGGQNIPLLIQLCFNILHTNNTQETPVKGYFRGWGYFWSKGDLRVYQKQHSQTFKGTYTSFSKLITGLVVKQMAVNQKENHKWFFFLFSQPK